MNQPTFLTVKDHSVSGEIFELKHDVALDMLITNPQPAPSDLPRYYESDDYISHTDGKRSLFENAYHLVKNIALANKTRLLSSLQPGKGRLLDIGAGTGDFLLAAKKSGWEILGTEPSGKARGIAESKGVSFAEQLSDLPDHSFDAITMWHVLEHVPDLDHQIGELKRLLKPTGIILIAVPNFRSFDAQHYGAFWAAYDVPRHLWHFSKTAIGKLFARRDFELQHVLPMKFDAFYVALLSEKYQSGRMNFLRAFWVGWRSNSRARTTGEYSSHIYVIKNANSRLNNA